MIESILLNLEIIINSFTVYSKESPIIAGAVSLWFLGTFSYFTRNIPRNIWEVIKKQSTTKLSIISTSEAFHNFLDWYNQNGYDKKLRSFKISSGRWGDADKARKSIGYGTHFFMHGFRPGIITLTQQENTVSSMERDSIDITMLGRNQKIYDNIFNQIKEEETIHNNLLVYKYDEYWKRSPLQRKRNIDTVFLNKSVKEKVLTFIDNFKSREDWYLKNGISYQTGIILYGSPGCGKTSFVKALASHYNTKLYILPVSSIRDINNAMFELPEYSMMLIEDIDTEGATRKRSEDVSQNQKLKLNDSSGKGKTEGEDGDILSMFSMSNLSDILNTIDGIITSHGRILIVTTNHIEKLDSALVRDGRFDLRVNLEYSDDYAIRKFINNYYPEYEISDKIKFQKELSIAKLQGLIMKNLDNPENVIEKIRKG